VFDLGDDWTHLCTVEPRARRPARDARDCPEGAPAVLGLGRYPGPPPAALGRGRR
jgi:hypothetical protein